MSTDIVQSKTFEEKMQARFRESIGDLIDDETIKGIVERGIEQTFFKKKVTTEGSSWSQKTIYHDSLIEEIIKETINKEIHEITLAKIDDYFKENNEKIHKQIMDEIKNNIDSAILNSLVRIFKPVAIEASAQIGAMVDCRLDRAGVPL